MADDTRPAPAADLRMTLSELNGSNHALWARCEVVSCGARAPIDTAAWERRGLAEARLADLEPRLRCVCGARRARLSAGPPVATYGRGPIYPFS